MISDVVKYLENLLFEISVFNQLQGCGKMKISVEKYGGIGNTVTISLCAKDTNLPIDVKEKLSDLFDNKSILTSVINEDLRDAVPSYTTIDASIYLEDVLSVPSEIKSSPLELDERCLSILLKDYNELSSDTHNFYRISDYYMADLCVYRDDSHKGITFISNYGNFLSGETNVYLKLDNIENSIVHYYLRYGDDSTRENKVVANNFIRFVEDNYKTISLKSRFI